MRSLEPFLPFMKLLLSALYQLPLTHVHTYRGVKLDLFEVPLNLYASPSTNFNPNRNSNLNTKPSTNSSTNANPKPNSNNPNVNTSLSHT